MAREGVKARSTRLLALPNLPALSSAADATWRACADACGFGDDMPRWREAVLRLAGLARVGATLAAADAERRWVAAALSLTGWSAGEGGRRRPLRCRRRHAQCMEDARTVGSGRQPLGSLDVTTTAAGAPSGHALLEPFDPFLEHRAWSPWLAAADGETLPAWMRIASLLLLPAEARGQQAVAGGRRRFLQLLLGLGGRRSFCRRFDRTAFQLRGKGRVATWHAVECGGLPSSYI